MIKNLLDDDKPDPEPETGSRPSASGTAVLGLFESGDADVGSNEKTTRFDPSSVEPRSLAEGARGMGLAYSAGIAFTAAVIFMLVLGWGADLLLGTAPWGIVGGIILGSIIGFVQFFRITSQIFKK